MSGNGQSRKDPFHVNRDGVKDNVKVVRKLRLPKGAQIRAREMYATVDSDNPIITIPFTGTLQLTVIDGAGSFTINNPFVTSTTPIAVSAGVATYIGPGQFNYDAPASGIFYITVGRATDARNNGFAQ